MRKALLLLTLIATQLIVNTAKGYEETETNGINNEISGLYTGNFHTPSFLASISNVEISSDLESKIEDEISGIVTGNFVEPPHGGIFDNISGLYTGNFRNYNTNDDSEPRLSSSASLPTSDKDSWKLSKDKTFKWKIKSVASNNDSLTITVEVIKDESLFFVEIFI